MKTELPDPIEPNELHFLRRIKHLEAQLLEERRLHQENLQRIATGLDNILLALHGFQLSLDWSIREMDYLRNLIRETAHEN